MQYLPTTGFADLATKGDVLAVKGDLTGLESSLRAEIRLVDASLRAEMRHGFEATELKMEAMEHRILGTLRNEMRLQLLAMVGIAIALAGLILRFG